MQYIRIRSYYPEGGWTGAEQLYLGNDQVRAIVRFRQAYPEHEKCIVVAEPYDSDSLKNKAHFQACLNCGCVN